MFDLLSLSAGWNELKIVTSSKPLRNGYKSFFYSTILMWQPKPTFEFFLRVKCRFGTCIKGHNEMAASVSKSVTCDICSHPKDQHPPFVQVSSIYNGD
jgi:hypothetical protein